MSGCGGAATALVFILFFSGASLAEKCDQNELMRCSTPLPMLSSPTDLSALNREELDNSCLELQAGIRCINNYTEHCMSPVERRRFNSMYEGVNSVMRDLCQRGSYQDSYLKHAHCIKKVKPEYEMCSKNYEITLTSVSQQRGNNNYTTDTQEAKHEEYLRTVCCSFQEYLLCSEQTVQRTCGDEAAVFTSVFLKRMASNIIKSYCLEYRGQECGMANTAARPGPGWLVLSAVLCSITAFSQLTSARENAHNVATSSLRLARALV